MSTFPWKGLFRDLTSYLYFCTFCTARYSAVTIRIVSLWPSIWTLPGSSRLPVFFRRTATVAGEGRTGRLADRFASLSAALLCGLFAEWPLPHLISTRAAFFSFVYRRTSSFQRWALSTGGPLRVIQPLCGHSKIALFKLSAT